MWNRALQLLPLRLAQAAVRYQASTHLARRTAAVTAAFHSRRNMSTITRINVPTLPAVGPYSVATVANGMVFVSGQIPINQATGKVEYGTIEEQTRLVLANMKTVLEAAGCNFEHVAKVSVFLKDMNDFETVNAIYAEAFGETRPARAAVQVARLPKDVSVEMECIAVVPAQ